MLAFKEIGLIVFSLIIGAVVCVLTFALIYSGTNSMPLVSAILNSIPKPDFSGASGTEFLPILLIVPCGAASVSVFLGIACTHWLLERWRVLGDAQAMPMKQSTIQD